jgi:hypothetical protein
MRPTVARLLPRLALLAFLGWSVLAAAVARAAEPDLTALATTLLGELGQCERALLRTAEHGGLADCQSHDPARNDPATAASWGPERRLRASLIEWLCRDPRARGFVRDTGLSVRGAAVVGWLDLSYANVPFPLLFRSCALPEGLFGREMRLVELLLSGSRCGPIQATQARISGSLLLDAGFVATGEIRLHGARIEGDLDCTDGVCDNRPGRTINADHAVIGGSVFLGGRFHSLGEVSLLGADIGGNLEANGGNFENPGRDALTADHVRVRGSVFLGDGFAATGAVNLLGADIGRQLSCRGGRFHNPGGGALSADGITVRGDVLLDEGFSSRGEVRLPGADLGGGLACGGGRFDNPQGTCLIAPRLAAKGDVFLDNGFSGLGEVVLIGAALGGDLSLTGGRFVNPGGAAVSADGIKVKGSVFLGEGLFAEGKVNFIDADIGGQLAVIGGELRNPSGTALGAESATIRVTALVKDIRAAGALVFSKATIAQTFEYTGIKTPDSVVLDLSAARIGLLDDEAASWPRKGNLILHGLTYEGMAPACPVTREQRLRWLTLQESPDPTSRRDSFSPQPYEQLAGVYRKHGYEKEATEVEIAKNDALLASGRLTGLDGLFHRFVGVTVGYGYRPWRPLWGIAVFLILGTVLFAKGHAWGLIRPVRDSGKGDYPAFHPFVYSVDTFVPIVHLFVSEFWLPSAKRFKILRLFGRHLTVTGGMLRAYLWVHIMFGWVLTTLFVLGFTGFIKK